MKRNLAVFTLLVSGLLTAGSSVEAASSYYCAAPYDLSSKPARMFTKVTGANFMSEKIAERILKSEVTKNADGKFKVGVDSFSLSDLTAGRFKGMQIHGENVVADGVYFSTMDLKTLCDFNYIVYDKKNSTAIFKEDFPLFFGVDEEGGKVEGRARHGAEVDAKHHLHDREDHAEHDEDGEVGEHQQTNALKHTVPISFFFCVDRMSDACSGNGGRSIAHAAAVHSLLNCMKTRRSICLASSRQL